MLRTIIYSHNDYSDILQIQIDQMSSLQNKILLFNRGGFYLSNIRADAFDTIVFYDDVLPYASRLVSSLKAISDEYILFTHENDIFFGYDETIISQLVQAMEINNIDRIDLQSNGGYRLEGNRFIEINREVAVEDWNIVEIHHIQNEKMYIGKHNAKGTYVYNVQPSIWKRTSLIDLMEKSKHSTYRSIEYDVEDLCMNYNIYNLCCPTNTLRSGYNSCTTIYKYMHITKYGRLLPMNGSNITQHGNSYEDLAEDYKKLIIKYNLRENKRVL